ncbi:MAG: cytochrome P450 [Solirubrobacteraceae bacterium]|nr:cytochrome P450 [Solirubrobacteraceae bacterium]
MSAVAAHPATAMVRASLRGMRRPSQAARRVTGPLSVPFDGFSPETIADPAAAYRRLHAHPGVHPAGRAVFALSGFDDVRTGAKANDVLISGQGVTLFPAAMPMLLTTDRPRHGDLRRVLARHFTAQRAEAMVPGMRELTGRALATMLARPGSDAVAELAIPLPVSVIGRLLGVPEADLPRLHRISDRLVEGTYAGTSLAALPKGLGASAAALELHRYMRGVFARLRREPGDDVISALLASQDGGTLGDDELFWMSLLLLVAGNETTTNLIGLLLIAFAEQPELYDRVRADPSRIPAAIEEGLRWGSPIQSMFRAAAADYQVGATTIPAGARVMLLFGAANRDPRVFPDPDRFALDRETHDHLGFGMGIHFCLGAQLARIEARVVLEELIERVSRIELAGPVSWRANPTVHGPSRLPVRLVP